MAERILDAPLTEIAEVKFIEYAREVIVSRALPDVRDGLKPVQRRILWAMYDAGYLPDAKHKKCARIVGDTMGKYHPHGDSSIYEALVKLEQPFVRRYPLVDGHGNFGTIDDGAAAMRYTEARLDNNAMLLLSGINKNTVPFIPNFDESEKEPAYLPARVPNLLLNGTSGIAIGMASEIPTHNMSEVIDATCHFIENPKCDTAGLLQYIKGPDFPTGGIMDPVSLEKCYATGRGAVAVRGEVTVESAPKGMNHIIIKSRPYGVKVESFLNKLAILVRDNGMDYVTEIRNESSSEVGMRLFVELAASADVQGFIDFILKKTELQSNYNFNMVALIDKRPHLFSLKEMISEFVDHRRDIFVKEMTYDLERARHRAMILSGLLLAIDKLDAVIALIRRSKSTKEAREGLMTLLNINQVQSQAILDLKLSRLTLLDVKDLEIELKGLNKSISRWEAILASPKKIDGEIIADLRAIQEADLNSRRKTSIMSFADMTYTPQVDTVIVCAEGNKYSVREKLGRWKGLSLKTSNSDTIFSITGLGMCRKFHANACGSIAEDSTIVGLVSEAQMPSGGALVFVSSDGMVKKTAFSDIANGKDYLEILKLSEGASVVGAHMVENGADLFLFTQNNLVIRFNVDEIPLTGRAGIGVAGIKLDSDNRVTHSWHGSNFKGYADTDLSAIKVQKRAGKGSRL